MGLPFFCRSPFAVTHTPPPTLALSNVITGDKAMTYQVKTAVNTATTSDNPNTQPAPLDTLPSEGFIRVMPLASRLGIHHQTLRRWWKNGLFPKPQHRNGILLFKNSEVKNWIDSQPLVIE